jgi:saccharopine dehydrogenase (NAD+, L-lysine-forming)
MQKSKTNETLKNRILVIGGYGMVGRRICKELGRRYPGRVFAVGRDLKKATDFSATTTGAVGPLRFDMHGDETPERLLKNAQLVIMCLDQSDSRFLEACILGRVTYIDITASADFHRMAERLGNVAKHIETTAILSVGLAPGLTNLLVKYITAEFDEIDDANIAILLGLGDRHGRAAVEWTVDNLHGDYEVLGRNGGTKRVQALSEGRRVTFPGIGMRTAYRFNFSDQHILPRTLSIPSVTSRLCFDSEIVGRLLAFLKRVGALALLRRPWIRG